MFPKKFAEVWNALARPAVCVDVDFYGKLHTLFRSFAKLVVLFEQVVVERKF